MKKYVLVVLCLCLTLIGFTAFGQDVPAENVDQSWLDSAFTFVKNLFNDTPLLGKILGGVLVIVGTWKVSYFQPLWKKLKENGKADWVGPVLGLIGGVATMYMQGDVSFSVLLAALGGGALAPYVADLLDVLYKIPGLSTVWKSVIEVLKVVLRAPKDSQQNFN